MIERLKSVELFRGLSEGDLRELAAGVEELTLAGGEDLFAEGQPGNRAYVITEGEVEIIKHRRRGGDVLLAVRGPGEVLGEIALLLDEPRSATVRARSTTTLISFSREQFEDLIAGSGSALRSVFGVVLERWRNTESKLRHSERMAQLGTLTAGMMHELNNPASAVARSISRLDGVIETYVITRDRAQQELGKEESFEALLPGDLDVPASPLAAADREQEIEDWLTGLGHEAPWQIAGQLAGSGHTIDILAGIEERAGGAAVAVLDHLAARLALAGDVREAEEGARRVSAIVDMLKSYTFVDQAPVQDVDVAAGVEDAIRLLGSELDGITVEREYQEGLPKIQAYAAELNQVWSNLLHNAVDAIAEAGASDGQILISVEGGEDRIVVRVQDNGAGIDEENVDRIFDPFFTTKEPGAGTGLGLDLVSGIIVDKHHGVIALESARNPTRFRVEIPPVRAV